MHVCVYCAASTTLAPVYHTAAAEFGRALGARGDTLVYGGSSHGLMGEVARGVHAGGGKVIGFIPRMLLNVEFAYDNADELVITEDMRTRKAGMASRADAFVALPGGIGTLEELFEIMTLRALGQLDKPLVLLNTNNFYDPLCALISKMGDEGFLRRTIDELFMLAADVPSALAHLDVGG
ncbi:MAG: TIGR00730 family Rossman fold protein [Chloroflexota bacterium]|nr:TIGR00730 family Rossman fold protein [Chloroflexota bacterium]